MIIVQIGVILLTSILISFHGTANTNLKEIIKNQEKIIDLLRKQALK